MVETAEGDILAPDATHEIEDGTLVTTLDGVVTEIVKPEMETPEVEISVEAEEFATVSHFNEVVESLESKIAQLTASIESLVSERVSHKEAMSKVVELVEKMIDLPSDEPTLKPHTPSKVESQFENLKKFAIFKSSKAFGLAGVLWLMSMAIPCTLELLGLKDL
jgi:myosin heavy subunit